MWRVIKIVSVLMLSLISTYSLDLESAVGGRTYIDLLTIQNKDQPLLQRVVRSVDRDTGTLKALYTGVSTFFGSLYNRFANMTRFEQKESANEHNLSSIRQIGSQVQGDILSENQTLIEDRDVFINTQNPSCLAKLCDALETVENLLYADKCLLRIGNFWYAHNGVKTCKVVMCGKVDPSYLLVYTTDGVWLKCSKTSKDFTMYVTQLPNVYYSRYLISDGSAWYVRSVPRGKFKKVIQRHLFAGRSVQLIDTDRVVHRITCVSHIAYSGIYKLPVVLKNDTSCVRDLGLLHVSLVVAGKNIHNMPAMDEYLLRVRDIWYIKTLRGELTKLEYYGISYETSYRRLLVWSGNTWYKFRKVPDSFRQFVYQLPLVYVSKSLQCDGKNLYMKQRGGCFLKFIARGVIDESTVRLICEDDTKMVLKRGSNVEIVLQNIIALPPES